jgi:arylsulfatase A-like enzyme
VSGGRREDVVSGVTVMWARRAALVTALFAYATGQLAFAQIQITTEQRTQARPNVDLYPTLSDLTAVPPPEGLEGRSLRPLLSDPRADGAHPAFSQSRRALANLGGNRGGGQGRGAGRAATAGGRGAAGRRVGGTPAQQQPASQAAAAAQSPVTAQGPAVGYSVRTELRNLATNPSYASNVAEMQQLLVRLRRAPSE